MTPDELRAVGLDPDDPAVARGLIHAREARRVGLREIPTYIDGQERDGKAALGDRTSGEAMLEKLTAAEAADDWPPA